jgi:hypothetical protein
MAAKAGYDGRFSFLQACCAQRLNSTLTQVV